MSATSFETIGNNVLKGAGVIGKEASKFANTNPLAKNIINNAQKMGKQAIETGKNLATKFTEETTPLNPQDGNSKKDTDINLGELLAKGKDFWDKNREKNNDVSQAKVSNPQDADEANYAFGNPQDAGETNPESTFIKQGNEEINKQSKINAEWQNFYNNVNTQLTNHNKSIEGTLLQLSSKRKEMLASIVPNSPASAPQQQQYPQQQPAFDIGQNQYQNQNQNWGGGWGQQ